MEVDDLKKITNTLTVLCSEKQKQEKVRVGLFLLGAACIYQLFVENQEGGQRGAGLCCRELGTPRAVTAFLGREHGNMAGAVTAQCWVLTQLWACPNNHPAPPGPE